MTHAEKIAAILREPATRRINFRYAGVSVWGRGYVGMAERIERGLITIGLNPNAREARLMAAAGVAAYREQENALYIPSASFLQSSELYERAQVVHEMTHALTDYAARQVLLRESEAVAFIAQMMYWHTNGIDTSTKFLDYTERLGTQGDEVSIFQAAWNIAHSILTTRGGYAVAGNAGGALESAITRHPLYRRRADERGAYDGI